MRFIVSRRGYLWFAAILLAGGCGGGADDGADAGSSDTDTQTETETETGTETETDTGTDTGEDETPPDLPELCATTLFNAVTSGEGDGRSPSIASSGSTVVGWLYDPEDAGTEEQWRVQAAAYDADAGTDPSVAEPFTAVPAAQYMAMAVSGDAFGAAWLDSRWDPLCDPSDPDSCAVDIAFAVFDDAATPSGDEPLQITTTGAARHELNLAPTPSGWLVAWTAADTGTLRAMAATIDASGVASAPQIISGEETFFNDSTGVALAAGPETAVAVWSADLSSVIAQVVGFDGVAVGDPIVVDDGASCMSPRITASEDGFLVTWSRKSYNDFEVFSQLLDSGGALVGSPNRLTWTTTDADGAVPAWNGSAFAVVWQCDRANGADACENEDCTAQLYGSVLDAQGALASVPTLLSDNANPSSNAEIAWDGAGWTALWEVRRNMRQQVYRGRFTCE
jgi:hypothetical protein